MAGSSHGDQDRRPWGRVWRGGFASTAPPIAPAAAGCTQLRSFGGREIFQAWGNPEQPEDLTSQHQERWGERQQGDAGPAAPKPTPAISPAWALLDTFPGQPLSLYPGDISSIAPPETLWIEIQRNVQAISAQGSPSILVLVKAGGGNTGCISAPGSPHRITEC